MENRVFMKTPMENHIEALRANTDKLRAESQVAMQGLPKFEPQALLDSPDKSTSISPPNMPAQESQPVAGILPPDHLYSTFEQAAIKYKIPVNVLMAIGQQESSYNPMARNGASSASGIMQYVSGTAKQQGINPFDPIQAINAAARQIRARLDAGGSMEEAVMGHHAGDGSFGKRAFNASDADYVKQVMGKAAQIGDILVAQRHKPAEQPKPQSAQSVQATKEAAPVDPVKMPGSVMDGFNRGTQAGRPDLAPIVGMDKEFFRKLQNQYDAMPPQQAQQAIKQIQNQNDVTSRAIKYIAEQRAMESAVLADTSPQNAVNRTVALATGKGRDARIAQYAKQGLNPQAAEALAFRDATIGADGMQVGDTQASEFDFDTQKTFKGADPVSRGVAKGLLGVGKAAVGTEQALSELVGLDSAAGVWANAGKYMRNKEAAIGERGDPIVGNLEGAISSISQQLPLMLTGSQALTLGGIALQSFGQEYTDGRATGQGGGEAAARASMFAAFEVIGEKFGLGESLAAIKGAAKGMPTDKIVDFLWSAFKKEVPGELITTTGQFGVDKLPGGVGLNTKAGFNEYMSQVGDTVLQTFMQSGLMAGGTTGVSSAVRYMKSRGDNERLAQIRADDAQTRAIDKVYATFGRTRTVEPYAGVQPAATNPEPAPTGPLTRAQQKAGTVEQQASELVGNSPVDAGLLADQIDAMRPQEEADQQQEAPAVDPASAESSAPVVTPLANPEVIESKDIQHEPEPVAEPIRAKDSAPDLAEMDEPALRERLKYVVQQAKNSGGWTKPMIQARKAIESEINKRVAAKQQELPVSEPSASGESAAEQAPAALPKALSGAKPRYSYGQKQFDLTFASDIDKAAYISAQKTPSKRDADYVAFVSQQTGMSEAEVRAHGQRVREAIKTQAKDAEPGMINVQAMHGRKVEQAEQATTEPVASKPEAPVKPQEAAVAEAIEMQPDAPVIEHPTARAVEPDLTEMDEPALRERLKYVAQQAKANGGWSKQSIAERKKIEAEINKRVEAAKPTVEQSAATATTADPKIIENRAENYYQRGNELIDEGRKEEGLHLMAQGDAILRGEQPTAFAPTDTKPAASHSTSFVPTHETPQGTQVAKVGNEWQEADGSIYEGEVYPIESNTAKKEADPTTNAAPYIHPTDPKQTWSGRGRKPQWVADHLSDGGSLEDLRADNAVMPSPAASVEQGQNQAPGVKANGQVERSVADRLQTLLDAMPANMKPMAQSARQHVKSVVDELRKEKTAVSINAMLETASDRFTKAGHAPFATVIDEVIDSLHQELSGAKAQDAAPTQDEIHEPKAETPRVAQEKSSTADQFAGNKIFTADKVAAARERMRKKLGQLNSGIDPELMIDGMTIAGAYIESGVRSFSTYAKTMIDDMGDGIKPYLLSFWEGARNYPGLNTEGMTSAEESAKLHAELNRELPTEAAEALGSELKKPAKRTKKTGAKSDMTLTQDWGVDHIDGYGDHYDRETGNAVKDQFLKESAKYLAAMADKLQEQGFIAHEDKKGRPQKPVSTNEGGTAGSGDVSLTMRHPDSGINVYVHVGESSLRGVVPTTPSGIAVMFRVSGKEGDRFATSGTNRWSPVDLSAADLTNIVLREVAGQENAQARPAQHGSKQNADKQQAESVASSGDTGREPNRVQADGAWEQTATVPGSDGGAVRSTDRRRATGDSEPVGDQHGSGRGAADRHGVPGGGSDSAGTSGRGNPRNYRITAGELKRTGSWRNTAEQNVKIVETVKQILTENRPATAEERALLTKFTGWGASEIANGVFPNQYGNYKDEAWRALGERLQAALTPEEYAQAKRTTQYAHYTSEPAIRSVYSALGRMGFNGGRILEPGMGVGLFNGLMPDAMAVNSQYTGIEYDTITGNIAKLLYPDSHIEVGDFTQTKLPRDFFDAAIGNPPFGNIKIMGDAEYKKHGFLLHDYFFAKTIDRVKPGGLLVFVTSKGTMDKANDRARKYLAERADLIGAIRMPQTAFKDNAGTEVVTDVIFLRKRMPGEQPSGQAWAGLKEISTPQGNAHINEYFADHPEMVLGRHALTGSMYRANEYTVEPIEGDIEAHFAKAIENLPENIYRPARGSQAERAAVQRRDYDPKVKKEGGLYVADDGTLMQVESGQGVPLTQREGANNKKIELKPKEVQFLKAWIGVRDALKQEQYEQLNDGQWEAALAKLNKAYDAFVAEHGHLLAHSVTERENEDGTTTVIRRFKNDPILREDFESALTRALETINSDGTISKGPVLLGRTINKLAVPRIESTQDAMFVSLNEVGSFDLAHVAKLAGKSEQEVITELGNTIYRDPAKGWTTADDYLSGNVVRKLKEAESAAKIDRDLARNIEALKAVQPKALAPQDIAVQLGSHWVPASDVQQFAKEAMEARLDVRYSPITRQWSVEGRGGSVSEWSVKGKDASDMLESVLNNRQIKITYRDSEGKTYTDAESTEKANDVAKKMREAFKKWIWSDSVRSERLARFYNENYNNIAPRTFDGAHLTLPGVSSRFNLRSHQKRAIWRTIQQGDTYYAHAVGAGKTFTMIAAGMEERRLGLSKKPMYVVPNHMLAQFSKEFLELYPTAQIMVADEHNFHTHNRRKFVAQAALNDPDAIVITHSAFGRIGMSKDFTQDFITEQIAQWQAVLDESDSGDRITRKQIERRIEQLENRLKAIIDNPKDQLMTFEELGVDRLFIDEAHEFRKLDFATNRGNIKGIDPSGSQRAMDLFMKVQYLRSKKPGRALVMASGTPVTNTMGELYTVQRFFDHGQMDEDGDGNFDAWSNHYGEVVDGLEQNAAGGYEAVSRFAKFVNVPELMSRVRSFMDILTGEQLGDVVQRPDVKTGGRQVIVTPVPDGFKDYQKDLERRIQAIRKRKGQPKPGDDIILSVIADGRFSAIDMRFVDHDLPSDPNSKLNRILDDMIAAYHESADHEYATVATKDPLKGASMMLFTDIGLGEQSAANRGFDMKRWIEKRLVEGGVKPEHIAFMRDNKAHAKKERLFDDLRQGRKRILIGGKDMETGVNAQKRLAYLFHLDAPWFPASVEQREGRIVRQGNQNPVADVRAYATKGSYDSTMWGMNARKQRFIEQAMSGDASVRSMEDVSEASAFEMAAALASGDERYLKLAGLKGDVERLGRLYSAHLDEQRKLAWNKQTTENAIAHNRATIAQIESALKRREVILPGEFAATLNGKTYDNRDEFSQAAFDDFNELAKSGVEGERVIGKIGGMDLQYVGVYLERSHGLAAELVVDIPGDNGPLLAWPLDPNSPINGIATRAANQVNGLDRQLQTTKGYLVENQDKLNKIGRRLGAAFPEQSELDEKKQALADLEVELAAESKADEVDPAQADAGPAVLSVADGVVPASERLSEQHILDLAEDAFKHLGHTPPLLIKESLSDMTGAADDAGGASGMVAGGKIHLFRDAISSSADAVKTIWHELLHYGIRRFLSVDQYIQHMRALANRDALIRKYATGWAKSAKSEKARKYAQNNSKLKNRVEDYVFARGVDEALAMLGEEVGPNNSLYAKNDVYHKAVRVVRDWLAWTADKLKIPHVGDWLRGLDNKAAREYVHAMFQKLRNDDPLPPGDLTRDDWLFTADGAFRRSQTKPESSLTLPEQTTLQLAQEHVQDSMERVKRLQKQIEAVTGVNIKERNDYYGAETNRPGRIAARLEEGKEKLFKPLVDRLAKSGHTLAQLEELLHAMHAPERYERLKKLGGNEDKSAEELVGMSLEQASAIRERYANEGELHAVANKAREITRITMSMRKQYGLITEDAYQALTGEGAYQYYVPLKGSGEYGPRVKRATGHGEREEHILENIFRDYELLVVAGEKNLARQSLLGMALANPDAELWTVGVLPKGRTVRPDASFRVLYHGSQVAEFRSQAEVRAFIDGDTKHGRDYVVEDERGERVVEFTKPLQDNEVPVYVKGEMVRIQIQDEKLASQIRPLDGAQMNAIFEIMRKANRWLSSVYTGYNPAFILRNAARDAITGTINMVGNEGAATAAKAWKHYPAALKVMRQWAATKRNSSGEMGRYLQEYRMHGGKTGASYMSDLEDQAKSIQRLYDDAYGAARYAKDGRIGKAGWIAARKSVAGMAHVVEIANQATENALRLALFTALRKQGVSPGEAARAAKAVTVNFDRKGKMTPMLGAWWLFFNPAVQGTANGLHTLIRGKHKYQAWALLGGLAALGVMAAQFGLDDDEDRWLGTSWDERTKNFRMRLGGVTLNVPMSQEFTPFYAFGVAIGEVLHGQSLAKAAVHMASSFLDAYIPLRNFLNPDSDNPAGDFAIAIMPTILQTPANIALNRNGWGREMRPDYDDDAPDSQKMYRSSKGGAADKIAQGIAKAGELAGASKYENDISKVSPETLKYLWRTYTGGLGQFVVDSADLAKLGITAPGDIEIGAVPVVRDFIKQNRVTPLRSRFYDLKREADQAKSEFSRATKAADDAALDRLYADDYKTAMESLAKWVGNEAKLVKSLRDEAVEINMSPDLTDSQKRAKLKSLEQEEEVMYREAIAVFKENTNLNPE